MCRKLGPYSPARQCALKLYRTAMTARFGFTVRVTWTVFVMPTLDDLLRYSFLNLSRLNIIGSVLRLGTC